jgi:AcrR family transcriptional regulator
MAAKKTLRRVPRQDRGERRLRKILDAADQVIAKVGYEAATTNAIARQARTSIGSLYQFFPNKEAILHALAARYLEELRALHHHMLNEEATWLPLAAVYDRIIGSLADFHASHPGFQPLFYGSATSAHLAAAAKELTQECIRRVDELMAAREPEIDPSTRRLYATINVEVIRALLQVAQASDPEFRARLLAETKALLLAHMKEVLGHARALSPVFQRQMQLRTGSERRRNSLPRTTAEFMRQDFLARKNLPRPASGGCARSP